MYKLALLPLLALGCFSPLGVADLGQDIVQTSERDVADDIKLIDGFNSELVLPLIGRIPGQVTTTATTPLTKSTFQGTRLGKALFGTPPGANKVERGAQFMIAYWHQVVLDLQLADYSRVGVDGYEVKAPENPGPAYASRALAIAHLAMYDAYVGVTRDASTYLNYRTHLYIPKGIPEGIKPIAAAAAAGLACAEVLTYMYQHEDDKVAIADAKHNFHDVVFQQFGNDIPFMNSVEPWPRIVAQTLIANRLTDGSGNPKINAFLPFERWSGGSNRTYEHTPDPTAKDPESGTQQFIYGSHWGKVEPFMFSKAKLPTLKKDFPAQTPLKNYLSDFKEVKDYGRNESADKPNQWRTPDQTRIGIFWAYDGGFRIGVPPRLYNSIADDVLIDLLSKADSNIATGFQMVKLYAMINVALGDASVAAWQDKYSFNFWRPIIGIRRGKESPVTAPFQDATWVQLGAPNTNRNKPGINPAFPAFPSGHATFGATSLEVLRLALRIAPSRKFEMHSDEFNGKAVDDFYCARFNDCVMDPTNPIEPGKANKRPHLPRTLTIDQAIEENNLSRIYLGVHWRADVEGGELLGKRIAQRIVRKFPKRIS